VGVSGEEGERVWGETSAWVGEGAGQLYLALESQL